MLYWHHCKLLCHIRKMSTLHHIKDLFHLSKNLYFQNKFEQEKITQSDSIYNFFMLCRLMSATNFFMNLKSNFDKLWVCSYLIRLVSNKERVVPRNNLTTVWENYEQIKMTTIQNLFNKQKILICTLKCFTTVIPIFSTNKCKYFV